MDGVTGTDILPRVVVTFVFVFVFVLAVPHPNKFEKNPVRGVGIAGDGICVAIV